MSVDGHYPVLKMFPLCGERRELIDVFDEVMPLSPQLNITTELKCDFQEIAGSGEEPPEALGSWLRETFEVPCINHKRLIVTKTVEVYRIYIASMESMSMFYPIIEM